MPEFQTKVNACIECGQHDQVAVESQSVGCRRCGVFCLSSTVEYVKYAIIKWNEVNR